MDIPPRFATLDDLLAEHAWLWRPQPFKEARPPWCEALPALVRELDGLGDEEAEGLADDGPALIDLLARHVPRLRELHGLTALPARGGAALRDLGPRFARDVPGRKWQQVSAFAAAVAPAGRPVVEWCAGKGHLGRLVGAQWAQPVTSVDIDAALCGAGEALAQRAGVAQRFLAADVLQPLPAGLLAGGHAVTLHACGDLHRRLVRAAVEQGAAALDVAPCCYHKAADEDAVALGSGARLRLSRDDLRLAVTETVTAPPRERRLRDREIAWKLGYDGLRRRVEGEDRYRPMAPIDKGWLKEGFEAFCRRLAARHGVALPAALDWGHWERHGAGRARGFLRHSLVRHAFRRPLELWLALDLARFLEGSGYRVELGVFCPRQLTPRNLLLSARS